MDSLQKLEMYMHHYMTGKKVFNWEVIKPISQVLYIWNLLTTHYDIETQKNIELIPSIFT